MQIHEPIAINFIYFFIIHVLSQQLISNTILKESLLVQNFKEK